MDDTAVFKTEHGSKYLQQLCKHFAHKREVSYTPEEGTVNLSVGRAQLKADETGLHIRIEAEDAEGIIRLRQVVDSHLKRFAFREGFEHMPWQGA